MKKSVLAQIALAAVTASVVAFVACEDTASQPTNYAPLLKSLTETVILPAHETFATQADALAGATATLQATPTADSLAKAQQAWRAARAALRNLDAYHFGPIADLGITDRIDVAPASSQDIDAIIAGATPIESVSVAGGKTKGFLGLEYLIFGKDGDAAVLVRLTGTGAPERRRALAHGIADEIAESAHQLADAWTVGKGGYASELENAGAGSQRYPTQRAAVDELVGGAGYALELVVGVRLAGPLGLRGSGSPDPSQDPTAASDSAVADMTGSLSGVRVLYQGNQGNGLSANVRPRAAAVDDKVNAAITDCTAKVGAIPPPFAGSITSATVVVNAAYESCKALKTTWNADLTSAIGATLKPADTDGD